MPHLKIVGSNGKRTLSGAVEIAGAKNAALKIIAASVLFDGPVSISNLPEIEDVSRMLDLIESMGAAVTRAPHRVTIDARRIGNRMTPEISKRLRASIVLTGPLLARFGSVSFPHPGGCVIGARPIDAFEDAFRAMGASITFKKKLYTVSASSGKLSGAEVFFKKQSVTGTETIMMAATRARGATVIKNAAMEPEIVWLAEVLNMCGARIVGAGTPTVTIVPAKRLSTKGKTIRVMPDRIEAGSFLILGALAAKSLEVRGAEAEHLESLIEHLRASGVPVSVRGKSIHVFAPKGKLRPVDIKTHEYPGFPTDLQAPMTVFLTQCEGESLVFETIFEGRLLYTDSLNQMGANIQLMDAHRALVRGKTALRGRKLESPDLRAGLAFVIAAVIAEGTSTIHSIYNIDRGYERIDERLRSLGVRVERLDE